MSIESKEQILERVEQSLESIRPYLQTDGGDIEVVELTDDMTLRVRLLGACESCSLSYMTMKAGVEENIKRDIPSIQRIEAINALTPQV